MRGVSIRKASLLVCLSLAIGEVEAASEAVVPQCATPAHRQFDFWIGDWDAYDVDDERAPSARVRVEAMLGGCALRERYDGADGLAGESFSIYDASRKIWHQTWVTNRGELLVIEGRFQDGRMTLEGNTVGSDGKQKTVRGVWKPENGRVREWAETSTDGGKTWTKWFDIVFRARQE